MNIIIVFCIYLAASYILNYFFLRQDIKDKPELSNNRFMLWIFSPITVLIAIVSLLEESEFTTRFFCVNNGGDKDRKKAKGRG